jgi:hypothetical protein
MRRPPGRASIGFVVILATLVAAPTVGDIGSCGTPAEPLGAPEFFSARLSLECDRCNTCGFTASPICKQVCADLQKKRFPSTFPDGCHPVTHDGDVCLNAIEALSCNDFGDLVTDPPIVPTECDFCPASATGSAQ